MNKTLYSGWELKYFDSATVFREYQYKFIKKHISGKTCEVGPGNGVICEKYKRKCDNISLFEPSKKQFLILKKKFKNQKKIKIFNKFFKKSTTKKYNSILYLDVLEHIKYPRKEILKSYKSLKKNGKIIVCLPAFQHLYSQFDKDVGHYKRYSINSFLKEIKNLEFSSIKHYYIDSFGYFISLISKIFSKNYKSNFEKKIFIWNLLVNISKLLDLLCLYKLGKSLIIILKK